MHADYTNDRFRIILETPSEYRTAQRAIVTYVRARAHLQSLLSWATAGRYKMRTWRWVSHLLSKLESGVWFCGVYPPRHTLTDRETRLLITALMACQQRHDTSLQERIEYDDMVASIDWLLLNRMPRRS